MPPEIETNRHDDKNKVEPHVNDQLLTGVQAAWRAEIAHILPASSPTESPLTYRREVNKTVHDYEQWDRDFKGLNARLHQQHSLSENYKVVGLAVYNGLPELVVIDKNMHHDGSAVSALAVSAENGTVTGTFTKGEHNRLRHSEFVEREQSLLPIPLRAGGTIWRDQNGEGKIREIDTPQGLKESINYDPRGHVQKLDFMMGANPLTSYQRNEDGSYDAISPHQGIVRGLVNDIKVVNDNSFDCGEIVFSMHGGRMTKWMRPNGQTRSVY